MKSYVVFLAVALLLTVSGCSQSPESGIEKANLDTSVRPQDNLYRFVNGTWLDNTVIPADKSNYGAFSELFEQSELNLRTIIEESAYAEEKPEGSELQQVGDFYLSFMDSVRVEEIGIEPLQEELDRIKSGSSKEDLVRLMGYFVQIGVQNPFYYYINQDQKQSDQYIGYIGQSGLGLPDRDYYFKDDQKFQDFRNKYVRYMKDLLVLAGEDQADHKALRMLQLETDLARGHWTRVENRDRDKTYNKYSINELEELTPGFSWKIYLAEA
ncbi:MAG: peptidase M13, partial [Calditrichaeota bacterium]